MNNPVKRGEIYLYDFGCDIGSVQGRKRPVVVIQSNELNCNIKTVIIAAVTSVIKRTDLSSHVVLGKNFGLKYPSMILLEQMKTIDATSLEEYIGIIDDDNVLQLIDKGIRKVLNIYKPVNKPSTRIISASSGENEISRGDIYLYDFGTNNGAILNGIRPVVVLQNDAINKNSPTTIVAAIVYAKRTYLPTHIYISDAYGLDDPSVILIEQIAVVNQESLLQKIGKIKDKYTFADLYNGLQMTMGLWRRPEKDDNIMCLCGNCLKSYFLDSQTIVRRADPFQKFKDRCFKCDGFGYDYIITSRNGGVHDGR